MRNEDKLVLIIIMVLSLTNCLVFFVESDILNRLSAIFLFLNITLFFMEIHFKIFKKFFNEYFAFCVLLYVLVLVVCLIMNSVDLILLKTSLKEGLDLASLDSESKWNLVAPSYGIANISIQFLCLWRFWPFFQKNIKKSKNTTVTAALI